MLRPPWRSWAALARSWVALATSCAALGPLLGRSWPLLAALGSLLGRSWPLLATLGPLLGAPGSPLGAFRGPVETHRPPMGHSWGPLGSLGSLLGRPLPLLAPPRALLGHPWGVSGPILGMPWSFQCCVGSFGSNFGPISTHRASFSPFLGSRSVSLRPSSPTPVDN